jgi:putative endonuclease
MNTLTEWRLGALERSLTALDWLGARRGRRSELPEHLITGERGEEAAFFFLIRGGFTVVARRWNDGPLPGDLDLIAWHGPVLCFVEVKTRSSREFSTASSAVDRDKRRILRRLAGHYLRHLPERDCLEEGGIGRPRTRFDIVTVYQLPGIQPEIHLIPGAFGWSERDES